MGGFRYGRQRSSGRYQQKTTNSQTSPGSPKDPYTVLGISPQSSLNEIKTAYHELAAKYHPDKVQHLGEEFGELAEARFKEIQEAYRQIREDRRDER
jgi:DnaJ-class molecular chaperone